LINARYQDRAYTCEAQALGHLSTDARQESN
jgi:hypothetical protein